MRTGGDSEPVMDGGGLRRFLLDTTMEQDGSDTDEPRF